MKNHKSINDTIYVKNENKFVKFISSMAVRTGQEFNASSVGAEVGIDDKTADDWVSILKNTGIVYLLQPHANNNVSRAIKRKKQP